MGNDNQLNCWEISLELLSPLQVGIGNLGMVEKTDLYVPNRVFRGAFTNSLVSYYGKQNKETFTKVTQELGQWGRDYGCAIHKGEPINPGQCGDFEQYRNIFSSLFLSTDECKTVWRPRYDLETNERIWVNGSTEKTEAELRQLLSFTVTSTAYSPLHKDINETLHATDLITHQYLSEDKSFKPVYLKGQFLLPKRIEELDVEPDEKVHQNILNRMRLGGGRKQGWGRVRCVKLEQKDFNSQNPTALDELPYKDKKYRWLLSPDFRCTSNPNAYGRAFLSVYRIYKPGTTQTGFGQNFSKGELCWEAGSLIPVTNE
ncbi:MAG: hypothetical protein GX117_05340 [Candidatus Hydrogenedentes bacterium]|nr:hypothetical protein [Candidatus Hydrogenedentota bacterium]